MRCNLIFPWFLTDQHLMAERRELRMIPPLLKKRIDSGKHTMRELPPRFTLGKGHMLFWLDKMLYLAKRFDALTEEMVRRGFKPNSDLTLDTSYATLSGMLNDWEPQPEDYVIIVERIRERVMKKMGWYRYCGQPVDEEWVNMTYHLTRRLSMQTSTLFIGNLTTIDYAYVHPTKHTICGGSLNLSVEVSGKIEPNENLVVDFGTIKKTIKNLIDDKEEGFDHKIWVPKDSADSAEYLITFPYNDSMVVSTSIFSLVCPKNAIKECNYADGMVSSSIKKYLEEKLNIEYPNSDIKVAVFLSDRPVLPFENVVSGCSFTYVHGLKNSTSWGCQNIAHGHKSWLLFVNGYGQSVPLSYELDLKIKEYIDDCMFIRRDNIIRDEDDDVGLMIGYETPRGKFYLAVDKKKIKTCILDTETTVEHLAEWFVSFFEEDMRKMWEKGVTTVYFSEGLVKGARVSLNERFDHVSI